MPRGGEEQGLHLSSIPDALNPRRHELQSRIAASDIPLAKINGRSVRIDGPDDMPLLWALRDVLGMTGTKFGCGLGLHGTCTVRRRCRNPIVHHVARLRCRKGDHNHRGRGKDSHRGRSATGVARRPSASVRLLSVDPDHVGIRGSGQESYQAITRRDVASSSEREPEGRRFRSNWSSRPTKVAVQIAAPAPQPANRVTARRKVNQRIVANGVCLRFAHCHG
jgi:hypothetical protein